MKQLQQGFTYIMILVAVIVLGIIAGATSTTFYYVTKADREAELLFRGLAYQNAIKSYYLAGKTVKSFPRSLEDLLLDPRFQQKRRHLRVLYADPMASADDDVSWTLVIASDGGIAGVASTISETPLKTANFPAGLAHFAGATSYTDWVFEYKPPAKKTP